MKNIVGQTPRGKDFYPRTKVIRKIYRRLDSGSHIFMSAPRRAGKTSIMRFLEDEPKKGYVFLYVSVEDIESSEEYFKLLSEELLSSEAVGKMVKASEKVYNPVYSGTINYETGTVLIPDISITSVVGTSSSIGVVVKPLNNDILC